MNKVFVAITTKYHVGCELIVCISLYARFLVLFDSLLYVMVNFQGLIVLSSDADSGCYSKPFSIGIG